LLTSGTPGLDGEGHLSQDFGVQAEQAWDNIVAVLATAGLAIGDIVRVTHFLTRREDLEAYRRICEKKLGSSTPVSTLVFVAGLPWPDMLIEIQVDAAAL
jgi:enamine deaminase RidA (YjgF/YER057c/UK114 family)